MKLGNNINYYKKIIINNILGISTCVVVFYDDNDNKYDDKTEHFHTEESADIFIDGLKQDIRIKKLKNII